jgi:hypothetical protein
VAAPATARARAPSAPICFQARGEKARRRQADDIPWALSGPDAYRLFVVERRWSRERLRDWLVDLLAHELLDTATAHP